MLAGTCILCSLWFCAQCLYSFEMFTLSNVLVYKDKGDQFCSLYCHKSVFLSSVGHKNLRSVTSVYSLRENCEQTEKFRLVHWKRTVEHVDVLFLALSASLQTCLHMRIIWRPSRCNSSIQTVKLVLSMERSISSVESTMIDAVLRYWGEPERAWKSCIVRLTFFKRAIILLKRWNI